MSIRSLIKSPLAHPKLVASSTGLKRVALLLSCLAAVSVPPVASAQDGGACTGGMAEAYLDANNVRARIFNDGVLFWSGAPGVYEVPKGGGSHTITHAALWLTGMVDDSLHVAGTLYVPVEYFPGPLNDDGSPPADCAEYDRIWSLDRDMMERYERMGVADSDLAEWPTGLGAPTLDAAGSLIDPMQWSFDERVDRVVDLEAGERPQLLGDQMHWWVMNDAAGDHSQRRAAPIGVEVQMTAFAFSGAGAISNTTFYRVLLRKPAGPPLTEAHFGLFADTAIGKFDDDYVGSDSALGLAFAYNADNLDEGQYGAAPPAQGFDFLRGPLVDGDGVDNDGDQVVDEAGERLSMTTASQLLDDRGTGQELHHRLQGLLVDGSPITAGGDGLSNSSGARTMWMYSGNPPEYWSELNLDGAGTASPNYWRSLVAGMGPFVLSSDQPQEIVIGLITSFGDDNLDSVRRLKEDDAFVQDLVDGGLLDPPPVREMPLEEFDFAASFFPSPASETTTLRYSLPREMSVHVEVADILGRRRQVVVDAVQVPGLYTQTLDVAGWQPGVYIARLRVGPRTFSRKLVVVR